MAPLLTNERHTSPEPYQEIFNNFDFVLLATYFDVSQEQRSVPLRVCLVNVVLGHALHEQVEHLRRVVVAEPGEDVEWRPALGVPGLGVYPGLGEEHPGGLDVPLLHGHVEGVVAVLVHCAPVDVVVEEDAGDGVVVALRSQVEPRLSGQVPLPDTGPRQQEVPHHHLIPNLETFI